MKPGFVSYIFPDPFDNTDRPGGYVWVLNHIPDIIAHMTVCDKAIFFAMFILYKAAQSTPVNSSVMAIIRNHRTGLYFVRSAVKLFQEAQIGARYFTGWS